MSGRVHLGCFHPRLSFQIRSSLNIKRNLKHLKKLSLSSYQRLEQKEILVLFLSAINSKCHIIYHLFKVKKHPSPTNSLQPYFKKVY